MHCRPDFLCLMDGFHGMGDFAEHASGRLYAPADVIVEYSRVDGLALGDHGGSIVTWDRGTVSKNAPSAAIPATPSAIRVVHLDKHADLATRQAGTNHISQRGRDRFSRRDRSSSQASNSRVSSTWASSGITRTCSWTSKVGASTHSGQPSPNVGW